MTRVARLRDRVLAGSRAYSAAQRAVSTDRGRRRFVDVLAARRGMRVLEVGCGTGDLVGRIPPVDYVGFDPSPSYIAAAREAYGDRGRFFVAGIDEVDADRLGPVDLIAVKGVLHHLDDDQVAAVARLAARVLAPAGRLMTMDPTLVPDQHPIARRLALADRGRYVRTPAGYRELLETHVEVQSVVVSDDVLRVPYNHAFVVATPVAVAVDAPDRAAA